MESNEFKVHTNKQSTEIENTDSSTKWKNQSNNEDSDDMFSDEEHCQLLPYNTPELLQTNNTVRTTDKFVTLTNQHFEVTPGKPFVPFTPISLVPLISECNQTWTSDMETPTTDVSKQNIVTPIDSLIKKGGEKTIDPMEKEIISSIASPILINKKRRRPKRRIFKSSNTNEENINDLSIDQVERTSKSSYSSDSISNYTENVTTLNNTLENIPEDENYIENHKTATKSSAVTDVMNTSSQDFFNNASFSMVDKICLDHASGPKIIQEKANETEEAKNTTDLVKSCRKKLKSTYASIDLEQKSILPPQNMNESIEQELISFKPTNVKSSVLNMPSGLNATQLVNLLDASEKSECDNFKKPEISSENLAHNSKQSKNECTLNNKSDHLNMNISCSETQLLACCDLADIMEDEQMNEWFKDVNHTKQDIKLNKLLSTISSDNLVSNNIIQSGFKTASGKSISINEDKLTKLKLLYEQLSTNTPETNEYSEIDSSKSKNLIPTNSSTTNEMNLINNNFEVNRSQTTHKEPLITSYECNNEKSIRNPVSGDKDSHKTNQNYTDSLVSQFAVQSDLKTASGENISIDKDSLMKTRDFHDIATDSHLSGNTLSSNLRDNTVQTAFTTASGKSIIIDKDKLLHAQQMFNEITDSETVVMPVNAIESNLTNAQNSSSLSTKLSKNKSNNFITLKNIHNISLNSSTISKGLQRKWLSDSDIKYRLSKSKSCENIQTVDEYNYTSNKKGAMMNTFSNNSDLKKSASVENFFDFATDCLMSNLHIDDIFENPVRRHTINQSTDWFSSYTSDSKLLSTNRKLMEQFSFPEEDLRKRAIKNSTNLVMSSVKNDFLGFTDEEIQQSKAAHWILKSYLETSNSTNSHLTVEDSVTSSQLQMKYSLDKNDIYFSVPSDISQYQNYKTSPDTESRKLLFDEFHKNYLNKNLISGKNVERNDVILNNIADTSPHKFLGFSPPDNHPVSIVTDIITNLTKFRLARTETIDDSTKENYSTNKSDITENKMLYQEKTELEAENDFRNQASFFSSFKTANGDNLQTDKTSSLGGFITASGQPIRISKHSMEKAKKLFDNENDYRGENAPLEGSHSAHRQPIHNAEQSAETVNKLFATDHQNEASLGGFKTASGHPIHIAEQSLKRAKQLFAAEHQDEAKSLGGFKTASGQPIHIAEQSLVKAKKLFATDHQDEATSLGGFKTASGHPIHNAERSSKTAKDLFAADQDEFPSLGGFKTASGQPIHIAEQNLERAKKLFATDHQDEVTSLGGFKTASGHPIHNSEQSLKRAKQFFAAEHQDEIPSLGGFKTASGQPIYIAEQSLERAKKLFASDHQDEVTSLEGFKTASCHPIHNAERSSKTAKDLFAADQDEFPSLGGFKTASGQSIHIAKQSLEKAKDLFATDHQDENPSLGGFKTANGQPIHIAEQSLERAKKLFASDHQDEVTSLGGFKTASGQSIHIAEQSLEKSKKLFATDYQDENPSLGGFKIANGQPIHIAEQNLKRSKQLFTSEHQDEIPSLDGFKTASGQSINISKGSLENAKKLYACELDNSNNLIHDSIGKLYIETNIHESSQSVRQLSNVQKLSDPNSSLGIQGTSLISEDKEIIKQSKPYFNLNQNFTTENNIAPDLLVERTGFTTAAGRTINISTEKMENAKRLFAEGDDDSPDFERNNDRLMLKRKIDNLDSNTPLSRSRMPRFKKPRNIAEPQIRKLFDYDLHNNIEKSEENVAAQTTENIKASLTGKIEDKIETNISVSQNTPTSPIIGNRRRKYKRKMIKMSSTIQNDKKEDNFDKTDKENCALKRHSLPATLNFKEETKQDLVYKYDTSDNIDEDRLAAIMLQDKMINMKKRRRPKPIMGSLFTYRNNNREQRITWKIVSGGKPPLPKSIEQIQQEQLDQNILDVTALNAISYSFHVSDIIGRNVNHKDVVSVNLSDNTRLVLNESGHATIAEFRRAFLASPGIDPTLIPVDWIDHHYRLIVWKLASMDRNMFNHAIIPRALTANRIIEELKYRYNREIDKAQRSSIRKILERDEIASKRIVLCISTINNLPENYQEKDKNLVQSSVMRKVEATDGWYTIPITFDIPMLHYITTGKIREGTKIVTHGAELLNCERGCHPLEISSDMSLKIHTNSTRRARWDAKLGFQRNSEPFPIKVQSIDPNGGTVGKISVVISRIFPILYKEKMADGQSIYRNARCEEKAAATFEQECQNKIETFYAKAEKDYQNIADSQGESQGEWDSERIVSATQSRQALVHREARREEFKQKMEQELRANLPPRRQVTPVLKIRVTDEDTSALVTIWSGNDDIFDSLKEGSCVSIYNASASGRRSGELHLSFNNFSLIKAEPTLNIMYPVRICTSIPDIHQPGFNPPYNEFDTVGIIVSITSAPRGMKNFEVVNIAFPVDDMNSKYLSIYFWQGVSISGYSNILVRGSIIACSNLEWRCNSSWIIPAGYYNEKTSFSCNPRQTHLRKPFESLKNEIKNRSEYVEKCAEEIAQEFEKMSAMKQSSNPGTPANKSLYSNSPQTPAMQNTSYIHTPVRSSAIKKRLELLSRYGEAPPLSPMITKSSTRVRSEFIPLQRTPDPK